MSSMKVQSTSFHKKVLKKLLFSFRKHRQCWSKFKQARTSTTSSSSFSLCTTWHCATRSSVSLRSVQFHLNNALHICNLNSFKTSSMIRASHHSSLKCSNTNVKRICRSVRYCRKCISIRRLPCMLTRQ